MKAHLCLNTVVFCSYDIVTINIKIIRQQLSFHTFSETFFLWLLSEVPIP